MQSVWAKAQGSDNRYLRSFRARGSEALFGQREEEKERGRGRMISVYKGEQTSWRRIQDPELERSTHKNKTKKSKQSFFLQRDVLLSYLLQVLFNLERIFIYFSFLIFYFLFFICLYLYLFIYLYQGF